MSLTEKVDFMINPDKAEKRKLDMEKAHQSARDATNCQLLKNLLQDFFSGSLMLFQTWPISGKVHHIQGNLQEY